MGNNEKYDNLMHMRIERISQVEILEQKVRPMEEVCAYSHYFDAADYAAKTFNMFSGELQMIELKCSNDMIEQMFDRFGERINTRRADDTHFLLRTEASISAGLVSWIMQFGTDLEVIAPVQLKEMVAQRAEMILRIYKGETDE